MKDEPEIQGYGAQTTGGFGGEVRHIESLNDSGARTLRNIIEQATRPTTIIPAIKGTIELGDPLQIPENISIDGLNHLIIAGKGLILNRGNNIIRNLYFIDIAGPGDAIRIGDPNQDRFVTKVVIDRCYFNNLSAAAADEFISVIYGAHAITISWCTFAFGNKVLLIGNGDAPELDSQITATLHHNRFFHCSRRMPYLRRGRVDIVNNWFDCWDYRPGEADSYGQSFGVLAADGGQVILENNVFEQDRFFKSGWLAAILHGGGYHIGARCSDGGKIHAIGNTKNKWWIKIADNGKTFERPYDFAVDPVDQVKGMINGEA